MPLLSLWQLPRMMTPLAGDKVIAVPICLPMQAACARSGTVGGAGGGGGGGASRVGGMGGIGGAGGAGMSRLRPRGSAWPPADTASSAAHKIIDKDFMVFSGWVLTGPSLNGNCGETVGKTVQFYSSKR